MSGHHRTRVRKSSAVVAAVVALILVPALGRLQLLGQQTGPNNPPLIVGSVVARDLFGFYGATCHGWDGRGHGPAAIALRVPPPDLTTIARRHNGTFPKASIELIITGADDAPPSHGSRDMPIWGPIFRGLDPHDRLNRVRIDNIVEYLASIQAK
jgi:Cytochrome c